MPKQDSGVEMEVGRASGVNVGGEVVDLLQLIKKFEL